MFPNKRMDERHLNSALLFYIVNQKGKNIHLLKYLL